MDKSTVYVAELDNKKTIVSDEKCDTIKILQPDNHYVLIQKYSHTPHRPDLCEITWYHCQKNTTRYMFL